MSSHQILRPAAPVAGFSHLHAAHCESGVTASLLRDQGLDLSEPMIFGIGSGLFFAHFSFFKVMGHPLTTFRSMPGSIFKKSCKRLGVRPNRETYRNETAAMRRLDDLLDQGVRVGLQTNIFWLPYIPKAMRVHFNGHNLIALERRGDVYIVSDPIMEDVFECPAHNLQRARFSGGPRFVSKGLLYHPTLTDPAPNLDDAARRGLTETCHSMLRIPRVFPWLALHGVRHLARRVEKWPRWRGDEGAKEWLAGVVRMQEEIGTGGAGFRYLYAAFLSELSREHGWHALGPLSDRLTEIGDQWRAFALQASRQARDKPSIGWKGISGLLMELADAEQQLFTDLDAARVGGPALLEAR